MDTALLAALVAAAAAVFAAVLSWTAAVRARRSSDRTHSWERLVWAVDVRRTPAEYEIRRTVLRAIRDLGWAPSDDRALADDTLQLLERSRTPMPRPAEEAPDVP